MRNCFCLEWRGRGEAKRKELVCKSIREKGAGDENAKIAREEARLVENSRREDVWIRRIESGTWGCRRRGFWRRNEPSQHVGSQGRSHFLQAPAFAYIDCVGGVNQSVVSGRPNEKTHGTTFRVRIQNSTEIPEFRMNPCQWFWIRERFMEYSWGRLVSFQNKTANRRTEPGRFLVLGGIVCEEQQTSKLFGGENEKQAHKHTHTLKNLKLKSTLTPARTPVAPDKEVGGTRGMATMSSASGEAKERKERRRNNPGIEEEKMMTARRKRCWHKEKKQNAIWWCAGGLDSPCAFCEKKEKEKQRRKKRMTWSLHSNFRKDRRGVSDDGSEDERKTAWNLEH